MKISTLILILILILLCAISLEGKASGGELQRERTENTFDTCLPDDFELKDKNTFLNRIELWVTYYLSHEVELEMEDVYPLYNVKDGLSRMSLNDIHFCEINSAGLKRSLNSVPDLKTISLLNTIFYNQMNDLDKSATAQKIFSCLALEESLGDPDTESSKKIYKNVTGKNLKPSGVKFYIDHLQKKESALNIGLYQFTPTLAGNINPCLKAWNKLFDKKQTCQVKTKSEALEALGSPAQNLNAFCGIHKIIETASVQMGSSNANAKFDPKVQCVSLQMKAGNAYNHFGPFQNSTGKNLASLAKCISSN